MNSVLPLFQVVRDAFSIIVQWVRTVMISIFSVNGALYPLRILFAIGVAIVIFLVAIRLIRSISWGA